MELNLAKHPDFQKYFPRYVILFLEYSQDGAQLKTSQASSLEEVTKRLQDTEAADSNETYGMRWNLLGVWELKQDAIIEFEMREVEVMLPPVKTNRVSLKEKPNES